MSDAKHTPGPWTASRCTTHEWHINSDENHWKAVASAYVNNFGPSEVGFDETEANAHLIAAAPDLLQFASNFNALFESLRPPQEMSFHEVAVETARVLRCLNELVPKCRTAIARATAQETERPGGQTDRPTESSKD